MDLHVPWIGSSLFALALLSLALLTTLVAARGAMSDDAVRAVKDDWYRDDQRTMTETRCEATCACSHCRSCSRVDARRREPVPLSARRSRASRSQFPRDHGSHPGVSHRMVVRHRLAARRRRRDDRRPGHVLSQPAGRRRGQREPLRAAAAAVRARGARDPGARAAAARPARRARRLRVSPRRPRRRPTCASTTGRSRATDDGYVARIAARDFALDADVSRDAAAAAAGRRRREPQGPAAGAGELLLQPAAARRRRARVTIAGTRDAGAPAPRGSITNGRASISPPTRAAGTGPASTSTTAAR